MKRAKQIAKVAKMRCPGCGKKRLMAGPDYDRWRLTCLSCGRRYRRKGK